MADIHDYLAAASETDAALAAVHELGARVEAGRLAGEESMPLAILLAGRAVALAIREASTRADYVRRDCP